MTSRLYYENGYLSKCQAKVIEVKNIKRKFGICLDQTCFYPEGGGQPGDIGTMNDIEIQDTQKIEGRIYHITDKSIPIGSNVELKLNWNHRYELMQAHSGQHVISECFWELMQAETFSVHLGKKTLSIDVKLPYFSWQDAARIESRANQIIFENRPILIHWHDHLEDLEQYPLRRPPKKKGEGGFRIVIVNDFDYSACGGIHTRTTGELGLMKITKWTKMKEGIKVEYVCGNRALKNYQQRSEILRDSSEKFKCSEEELVPLIEKVQADLEKTQEQLSNLSKKMMEYEVPELIAQAQQISGVYLIIHQFFNRNMQELREIESKLIKKVKSIVIFTNLIEDSNKLQLIFGRTPEIESKELHMGNLLKETAKILNGKGGGKPEFAQGGGNPTNLPQALEFIENKIKNIIFE
ncbi:Alanine--tRNA ligase [Candidatus Lokiarchaeum ossiferum]|uniref:Alanine--tRNA ligase n=1 Tax=Candidatus Lokiarchaeum ossiferum TaxID=2951803 RepID=A0ABY6HR42_9ARCH|nr:Alanine--tRNA ligase [Candidatus Lokiarchaeum sp. B-35]